MSRILRLLLPFSILLLASLSYSQTEDFFIQRALSLNKLVKEKNRYIEQLDERMIIDLPVGIRKSIGNSDYTVIIDSISFTREGGFITSYLVIDLPGVEPLCFRGTKIRFSSKGGLSGEAELQLLGNRSLEVGKGATLQLNGESTKAIWDCDGFKMVSLDGVVLFDRSVLVPENTAGEVIEGEVTASIRTDVIDFSNLLVEISVDGFQIPKLPGFGIHAKSVILDLSDLANSSAMYFPKAYRDIYGDDIGTWRGLNFRSITVYLPPFISDSGERIRVKGTNILLDEFGFSGSLEADNILSLERGSIDGWAFSLEELKLRLMRSSIEEASLRGGITLPIMKDGSDFRYQTRLDDEGSLQFIVNSKDFIEVPAFGQAKMLLYPSSRILVNTKSGGATVSSKLTGALMIMNNEQDGPHLDFGKIEFQNLMINSSAPFISGGVFDLSGVNRNLVGFPIALHQVGFSEGSGDQTELQLGFGVGLSNDASGSFSGAALASIKINTKNTRRFVFDGIEVEKVRVDIDGGAFKVRGLLAHFDQDQVYGNGFKGSVKAVFAPDIKIDADLMFGRKEDFRFYYVSGNALFPTGVPFAGGVALYGFSGGAMNRMRVEESDFGLLKYVPDKESGQGFRAGISIGTTPNRKAFNAEANLQMVFNSNGGLSEMMVEGVANFMEPPASLNQNYLSTLSSDAYRGRNLRRGQISGDLLLYYNSRMKTFHGNIKAYANVVNGAIRGSGPQNLAGEAVLHFAPDDWYVHIGTPSQRLGLLFGMENINVEADAYFMAGTSVPESPPPPEIISSILGDLDLDYMRDFNALASGAGFAFGSSFSMDTGEKQFLIFFARMQAGVGFDVMMKDYGNDTFCNGQEQAVGMNGWYANGQAYGYFQGAIGIKVDLPFASGKYKIMDIGSAILLQAQLPNPTWMKGTVGGYYELMNGLVKGQCRFELEIGKKCDLGEYSALQGLKVISAMTPVDGQTEVDVFISPQVAFNIPVNEPFKIKDINNQEYEYKIDIEDISLFQNGLPVAADIKLNYNNSVAALQTIDILKSQSDYSFKASLIFMERSGNGWKPLVRGGKPYREENEIKFASGVAPDFIPLENIEFAYPILGDAHFYSDYSNEGQVKLKKGQPGLFQEDGMRHTVEFIYQDQVVKEVELDYSSALIEFEIPPLTSGLGYRMRYSSSPTEEVKTDQNLSDSYVTVNESAEVLERTLTGSIALDVDKTLLEYDIQVSRYERLSSKISSWTMSSFFLDSSPVWYLKNLVTFYQGDELIGSDEDSSTDVIEANAILSNSVYYNEQVYPLVYDEYPLDGDITVSRDTELLGLPPIKAVTLSAGEARSKLLWQLTPVMAQDFQEIQKQVVRRYINKQSLNNRFRQIILERYPVVMYGNFDVMIKYRIPGSERVVDEFPLRFYLPKEY